MNEQDAILSARTLLAREREKSAQAHAMSGKPSRMVFGRELRVGMNMDNPEVTKRDAKWLIRFDWILPPDIGSCPSSTLVEVDDVTGETTIIQSL